jgi:hypothetical protein
MHWETNQFMWLALLRWSVAEPAIFPRYTCTSVLFLCYQQSHWLLTSHLSQSLYLTATEISIIKNSISFFHAVNIFPVPQFTEKSSNNTHAVFDYRVICDRNNNHNSRENGRRILSSILISTFHPQKKFFFVVHCAECFNLVRIIYRPRC